MRRGEYVCDNCGHFEYLHVRDDGPCETLIRPYDDFETEVCECAGFTSEALDRRDLFRSGFPGGRF